MKWIVITAIIMITVLETIALLKGMDGYLLTIVIGTLAGLGGLAIKRPW